MELTVTSPNAVIVWNHNTGRMIVRNVTSGDRATFGDLADVQAELAKSTDADFLIDQFSAFKGWKQKADPTATKQKNTARLEGNVTPQGVPHTTGSSVLPDSKGLAIGYNSVRRGP